MREFIIGGSIIAPHIVASLCLGVLCVGVVGIVWWLVFLMLDELFD